MNEITLTDMRNKVWKDATTPWVIVCDMDEIVGINENELIEEDKKGVNVIKTQGYDMFGKSEKEDLSNIIIDSITTSEKSDFHSKKLCFKKDAIEAMNFEAGAHESNPIAKAGNKVTFSEKTYILYHFKKLGKPYYIYTQKRATPRAVEMAKIGMSTHYTENEKSNEEILRTNNKVIVELPALSTRYISQ
jgi:hypothetical protein